MDEEELQYEDDAGVIPAGYSPPEEDYPTEFSSQRAAPATEPNEISLDDFIKTLPPAAPSRAADLGPNEMTPDEFFNSPMTASRPGAFARGFAEGVVPAAAGMGGGILAGAGSGFLAGAAGAGPVGAGVGAIGGGVVGGLAAGYGGAMLQDWILEALGMREGTGPFSRQQQATDEALFPYSRAAGGMAAAAPTLRPGGKLVERGIGAFIGGTSEAAMDAYQTGHVDPVKVGMGMAVGAALPNINRPTSNLVARVTPKSWQPHLPNYEAPPPEAPPEAPPAAPAASPAVQPRARYEPPPPNEIERMIQSATEQRNTFDPNTDPVMYSYWESHRQALIDRQRAGYAGLSDPDLTPQGAGPQATPRRMDLGNDTTTVAPGTAAENRPVNIPEVGMPGGGAPMAAREAARPNTPERNYAKDERPGDTGNITQPSTPVSSGTIPDDMRAALGGWESPRQTAPRRAVASALEQGVTDVNRPQPAAPAAPAQQSWADIRKRLWEPTPEAPAAAPATAPATPTPAAAPPGVVAPLRAARRAPPPPAAPASEVARPPAPAPAVKPNEAADLASKILLVHGNDPAAARKFLEGHLTDPTARAAHALMVQAERNMTPSTPTLKAVPPAAPVVAPARRKATPAEVAAYNAEIMQKVEQAKRMKSRDTPMRTPAAERAVAAAKARQAASAPKPDIVAPVTPAERQARAKVATPPEPPAPKSPPEAHEVPTYKVDLNEREREIGRLLNNKPRLTTEAAKRGMTPEALRAQLNNELATMRGKVPAKAPEPAPVKAVPPGREKALATFTAKKAKAAPVTEPVTKPAAKDPVAKMSADEQKVLAKALDIDTSKPTWLDTLRSAMRSEEGAIDIGPERPWMEAPRFSMQEAKTFFSKLKTKLYDQPGTFIADSFSALQRGSSAWGRQALDEMIKRHPELETKPTVKEAREILAERGNLEPNPPAAEVNIPRSPGKLPARATAKAEPAEEQPYTPPGKRAPRMVFDPITGEPRETRVWTDADRVKAEDAGYTPSEMAKIGKLLPSLSEKHQTDLITAMQEAPRARVLEAVDQLLAKYGKEGERYVLSNGTTAAGAADHAHKQGILDVREKAYSDNQPKPGETDGQTKSRALRIVQQANANIKELVAQLKADEQFKGSKYNFDGQYTPQTNKTDGDTMVRLANKVVNNRKGALKEFRDAELVTPSMARETERIGADIAKRPHLTDEAAAPNIERDIAQRPSGRVDYDPIVFPKDPEKTTAHATLTDYLNGLSDRDHASLQDAWGAPLDMEIKTTKNPFDMFLQVLGKLAEIQAERNKMAFHIDGPTVKDTPIKSAKDIPLTEEEILKLPNRPVSWYKRTVPGAKASEGRVIEPTFGDIESAQATLARAERKGGKFDLAEEEAKAKEGAGEQKSVLERASDFFGPVTWRKTKKAAIDEEGALDVTKLFDWIDKAVKKFSPDKEPMVPTGMTRLYRDGNEPWSTKANVPEPTKYVDVPTGVVEQYRVDGKSGATGKAADKFAKKWDEEVKLPDGPDTRQPLEKQDVPLIDHLRKLWADESGAVATPRLPQWIPNIRTRLRDAFTSNADPHVLQYMTDLGERAVKMRTAIARPMRDLIYDLRKATYDDGSVPTQAEAGKMYRLLENRRIDDLSPKERAYFDKHVDPVIKMAEKKYDELRDIMVRNEFHGYKDMPERTDNGPGYAQFVFRRQNKPFDEATGFDAITNRSSLSLWTDSIEPRKWFTFQQDGTGQRRLYHITKENADGTGGDVMFYKNREVIAKLRKDQLPEGFDPQKVGSKAGDMVVDHAKIDEIEAHGRDENGKVKYHDNPLLVASDAYVGLSRSLERAKFLEQLRNDPKFQEYVAPNETAAKDKWGDANVAPTIMPQFKGRWFPKQVAWALDDMVKQGFNYNGSQFMEGLARFNQATLKPFYFIGPEVHVMNELDKWIIGRGFDNLNLAKTFRNFGKAAKSVRMQDELQTEIMQAGGNPMFIHAMTSRMFPQIAEILKADIATRPWKYDPIRAVFGKDIKPTWEKWYQESNKMMWWQSDILYSAIYNDMKDRHGGGNKVWEKKYDEYAKLQKLENPTAEQITKRDELAAWKADLERKSVHETEKIIDSYVVPTTFGKSVGLEGTDAGRAIQKFMTDPATANFGRFSYGLIKTLASVVKNMAGKNENMSTPASMALGFSQAAMLGFMASVVYPYMSKAYQQMPWAKPESEVEKRGVTSVATIPVDLVNKGVKDGWNKLSRRLWSPSTAAGGALELLQNRDAIGRPIFESGSGVGEVPGQAAEYALGKLFSPAAGISRAASQEGVGYSALRFLESNFGVKTPTDAQIKYEMQHENILRRQGKSRERHPRGVLESAGTAIHKAIRGYEEGGLVTATATEGVIPTSRR